MSAPAVVTTARNTVINPEPTSAAYHSPSSTVVVERTFTTNEAGRSAARSTRKTTAVYALYCGRASTIDAPVPSAEADKTYTLLYTLRSNVDTVIQHQVGWGGGVNSIAALAVNHDLAAGVELHVRRTTTVPSGGWVGTQLFNKFQWFAGSGDVGDWFEISDLLWVEGEYDGPWFDGTIPDTDESYGSTLDGFSFTRETNVFAWEGDPDFSVSQWTRTLQPFGTYREEIAYALSTVEGVTGHQYVVGSTDPGTAYVRLDRIEYPNPFGGVAHLNVVVLLPQDLADAERWIEARLPALREAVGEHLVITSVQPQQLQLTGVGVLPALFINGHREHEEN